MSCTPSSIRASDIDGMIDRTPAYDSPEDIQARRLGDAMTHAGGHAGPVDAILDSPAAQEALVAAQESDHEVALRPLSQWQLAWRRFRRHRMAVVGSVIVGTMVVIAI